MVIGVLGRTLHCKKEEKLRTHNNTAYNCTKMRVQTKVGLRGFNFKTGDHMEHCSVTHHTWYPARTSKQGTVREEESTHTTNIKHSASCVLDKSDTGKWVSEEAVVDSGSVECVTSKNRMPHLRVEETPESRRGETWSCAGGNEIKKEGKVTVNWRTDLGTMKRGVFKVPVSRTLISVDTLQETGHDVILT